MNTFIHYLKKNGCYLISISLLIVLGQSAVQAQVSSLSKGDRVRIYAPGIQSKSIVGTVYQVSTSAVLVSAKNSSITIPFSSVKKLDISKGKRRRAGRGALIGLAAGALTGGIIGAATFKECNEEGLFACFMVPESPGDAFVMGAAAGGISGLVLGTIVGVAIKTDKWERVPVTFSAGLAPVSATGLSLHPTVSVRLPLNRKNQGH